VVCIFALRTKKLPSLLSKIFLCFISLVYATSALALRPSSELYEAWLNDSASPFPSNANDYQYVLIPGYMNELRPKVFKVAQYSLREFGGVDTQYIRKVEFKSYWRPEKILETISTTVHDMSRGSDRPIVAICESLGGLYFLDFMVKHADFAKKHVKAGFFVQSPFGGSPLADYLLMRRNNKISLAVRQNLDIWTKTFPLAVGLAMRLGGYGANLEKMSSRPNGTFYVHRKEIGEELFDILDERSYFITASHEQPAQRFKRKRRQAFERYCARLLHTLDRKHDGFVLLEDQYIPDLGHTIELEEGFPHGALMVHPGLLRASLLTVE
jgi:hypothetical protein